MSRKIAFTVTGILFAAGATYGLLSLGDKPLSGPFVPPKGTVPLRVSQETTVVTEPLLPGGDAVDFFAVLDQLCSVDADSEDNGFRNIVQFMGRSIFEDISDEKWQILCKKLGINPDESPRLHYLPLIEFLSDAVEKSESKTPQWNPDGNRFFEKSVRAKAWQIRFSFSQREEVPVENLELLERWVTEMEPAMDAVAESLKKKLYVVPPVGKLEIPESEILSQLDLSTVDWPDFLSNIRTHRQIAEMFSFRCLFRQIKHDRKSWDDVLSLFRVARRFGRQPFPGSVNFAVAFEKTAAVYATEILKAAEFDAEQLRQCLADLAALPEQAKFDDRLEYIRFGWLKNISEFPQKGPVVFHLLILPIPDRPFVTEEEKKAIRQLNAKTETAIRIYRTVPFDWNIVAEIMNAEFADRLGNSAKQTIFQSNPALRKIYEETNVPEHSFDEIREITRDGLRGLMNHIEKTPDTEWNIDRLKKMSMEQRSVYWGKALFASYAPTAELFAYEVREGAAAFATAKTAIALQLYKIESGSYPASLDDLVEKGHLPDIPNDPYRSDVSLPLMYRCEADGSCLVYSVGPNGIDDGGKHSSQFSPEHDDIVIQLN